MLRVFLDDCLARLMAGELDATTAAIAKLNATEIQGKALDELLQLYGGYGYMAEYGIGRAWSDARALRLFGGTSEIMGDHRPRLRLKPRRPTRIRRAPASRPAAARAPRGCRR